MTYRTIYIGTVPSEEPCAQTGRTPGWVALQQLEASVYRAALIGRFGAEPEGACLRIVSQGHDFGTYVELVLRYDSSKELAVSYAEAVEQGLRRWKDAGFEAPIAYGPEGSIVAGSQLSVDECIIRAMVRLRRLVVADYGTVRDKEIILNLERHYPGHAREAEKRLAEILGKGG